MNLNINTFYFCTKEDFRRAQSRGEWPRLYTLCLREKKTGHGKTDGFKFHRSVGVFSFPPCILTQQAGSRLHVRTSQRPCFGLGWCSALSLTCAIGQATVAWVLEGLVLPAASTGALLTSCCGCSGWTTWMSVCPGGSKYKADRHKSLWKRQRCAPPKSPYSLSCYLWEVSPVIVLLVFDSTEAGPEQRDPCKLPSW